MATCRTPCVELNSIIFFVKDLFTCVNSTMTERESEIFQSLVQSPNACNSQVWARLKPGARSSVLVSHIGRRNSRNHHPQPHGGWIGSRGAGTRTDTPMQAAGVPNGDLTHDTTTPAPLFFLIRPNQLLLLFGLISHQPAPATPWRGWTSWP